MPEILTPLEPLQNRLLTLHGVCNKVRGDGDSHMRGMSCLLTGIELFPGNIQGGSDTPAGWASGISIDQEIKNYLQDQPEGRTRFGSLELGLVVPDRAIPGRAGCLPAPTNRWLRSTIPYQTFEKLYGRIQDQETLATILDDVQLDLQKVRERGQCGRSETAGRTRVVRACHGAGIAGGQADEAGCRASRVGGGRQEHERQPAEAEPDADRSARPQSRLRLDPRGHAAVHQFVGQARMRWLGIDESHHELSHDPDSKIESQEKLTKINKWYCEQVAYLVRKLAETPEPGGDGTLLDHTAVVWTNELGKGNSHTLNDIPFVIVGNGLGFRMGRSLQYDHVTHNRLLMALAHAFGHHVETFGKPELCEGGVLPDLV